MVEPDKPVISGQRLFRVCSFRREYIVYMYSLYVYVHVHTFAMIIFLFLFLSPFLHPSLSPLPPSLPPSLLLSDRTVVKVSEAMRPTYTRALQLSAPSISSGQMTESGLKYRLTLTRDILGWVTCVHTWKNSGARWASNPWTAISSGEYNMRVCHTTGCIIYCSSSSMRGSAVYVI